jgi:hypothetical protein
MPAARRLLLPALLACLGLLLAGGAQARVDAGPGAPQGLKAFLLRADEPVRHEFNRTPSFAWAPVRGALRYEFELATTRTFTESSIVWSNSKDELEAAPAAPTATPTSPGAAAPPAGADETLRKIYANLRSPAISLDVSLPWITGSPYALYAHVRAVTRNGVTPWSAPFGFNIRWSTIPRDLDSPHPGLIRWSPVEGATAYEVWLFGAKRTFMTTTNVADARELYTFHRGNPAYTGTIRFRVRAQRKVYGEILSGLPTTTWGPWSPVYADAQAPLSSGPLRNVASVSDVVSDTGGVRPHVLTPGFAFGGDSGGPADFAGGAPAELYRVYIATDRDCVNVVFRGAIVGSPAYAPRSTGPLALPKDDLGIARARTSVLDVGSEPDAFMLDGTAAITTEDSSGGAGTGGGTAGSSGAGSSASKAAARIDLPDTAWPSGGYYWTVVPVHAVPKASDTPAAPGAGVPVEYRESELPQDACQAGRVMRFGKSTPPVVTAPGRPYASGLSPTGRLVSALRRGPSFYGTPLVAWEPVLGAQEYEVQWSRSANPWRPVGTLVTGATSSLLPLEPGTWHYRVRGYNHSLPKRPQMAWSAATSLKVTKPTFRVVKRAGAKK